MPSIRDLRRHLSAAGIDHSEAKNRAALETLCIEHGLAERVEVRPSGPPCARCRKPLVGEFLAIGASRFHKHCCVCAVCAAPVSGEVIVGRGGALGKAGRRNEGGGPSEVALDGPASRRVPIRLRDHMPSR